MLTAKEIVEKSNAAILKQGKLANTGHAVLAGQCSYYIHDGGPRCAVGILLSEEDAKALEKKYCLGPICSISNSNKEEVFTIFERNGIDLSDARTLSTLHWLQMHHDSVDTFEQWKTNQYELDKLVEV